MPETYGNKQVVQGEDIILLVDDKTTLHATTHTLKVDLEMKELRTKDTDGKEKWPGRCLVVGGWRRIGGRRRFDREQPYRRGGPRPGTSEETRRGGRQVAAHGTCEDVHGQSLHHDLFALDACGRQRLLQLFAYRQRQPDAGRQT